MLRGGGRAAGTTSSTRRTRFGHSGGMIDEGALLTRFPLVFAEAALGRIKELKARCDDAGIEVAVVNNGCRPNG